MEWRVLEENVLYQTLVNISIDDLTSRYNVIKGSCPLNDNKGTYLLFAHAHASQHNRHNDLFQMCLIKCFIVVDYEAA